MSAEHEASRSAPAQQEETASEAALDPGGNEHDDRPSHAKLDQVEADVLLVGSAPVGHSFDGEVGEDPHGAGDEDRGGDSFGHTKREHDHERAGYSATGSESSALQEETGTRELVARAISKAAGREACWANAQDRRFITRSKMAAEECEDFMRMADAAIAAASLPSGDGERCRTCGGEGSVWVEAPGDRPDPETGEWGVTDECPECGGPGVVPAPAPPSGETGGCDVSSLVRTVRSFLRDGVLDSGHEDDYRTVQGACGAHSVTREQFLAVADELRLAAAPPAGETGVNAAAFRRATTAGLDWSKLTPTQRESWAGETGDGREHACAWCPTEVRDLKAVAHNANLAIRFALSGGGDWDRARRKLRYLDEALARYGPEVDAHFEAVGVYPPSEGARA